MKSNQYGTLPRKWNAIQSIIEGTLLGGKPSSYFTPFQEGNHLLILVGKHKVDIWPISWLDKGELKEKNLQQFAIMVKDDIL